MEKFVQGIFKTKLEIQIIIRKKEKKKQQQQQQL